MDGGSTQELLAIRQGFWRISETTVVIHECPLKRSCVGATNFSQGVDGQCRTGYLGPLCAVCDPNAYYFNPDSEQCLPCDDLQNPLDLLVSSPTLLVGLVLLFLCLVFMCSIFHATNQTDLNNRVLMAMELQEDVETLSYAAQVLARMSASAKQSKIKLKVSCPAISPNLIVYIICNGLLMEATFLLGDGVMVPSPGMYLTHLRCLCACVRVLASGPCFLWTDYSKHWFQLRR